MCDAMNKTNKKKDNGISVVRQVRADDVCVGDYVVVMHESYDFVSMACFSDADSTKVERVTVLPNETKPPVRIEAVCVPFLMVKAVGGKRTMVDMRRVQLGQVSSRFGRSVFAALRPKRSKKSGKAGRSRKSRRSRKK